MTLATSFGDGDVLLWMAEFFLFVVWFWLLIAIFGDLFRDHDLSGGLKAFWILFVVVFPLIGILAYFLIRGKGMAGRAVKQQQEAQAQFDAYVKSTVGTTGSPTDQIVQGKALLDAGTITQAEFDGLKAKALS